MTAITSVNLSNAEAAYTVANTPLFLVRKLRSDPAVMQIAQKNAGENLFADLVQALGKEPKSLSEYVAPYALVIALSQQQNQNFLRRALSLSSPYHHWFSYITNHLVQSIIPRMTTNVKFQSIARKQPISYNVRSPSTTTSLKLS